MLTVGISIVLELVDDTLLATLFELLNRQFSELGVQREAHRNGHIQLDEKQSHLNYCAAYFVDGHHAEVLQRELKHRRYKQRYR